MTRKGIILAGGSGTELAALAEPMRSNAYGQYLLRVLSERGVKQ